MAPRKKPRDKQKLLKESKRSQKDIQAGKFGTTKEAGFVPIEERSAGIKTPRKFRNLQLVRSGGELEPGPRSEIKQFEKEQKRLGVPEQAFGREQLGKTEGAIISGLETEVKAGTGQLITDAVLAGASSEEIELLIKENATGAPPVDVSSPELEQLAAERTASLNQEEDEGFTFKQEGQGLLGGDYLTGRNIALAAGAGVLIAGGIIAAGEGVLGAAAANVVRRTFSTSATRAIATRGLSIPGVARVAGGSRITQAAQASVRALRLSGGSARWTTVGARKTIQYFSRVAGAAKRPAAVVGILGVLSYTSLFWGPNEKGDALTSLGIAQKTALNNGDFDQVAQIAEDIEEAQAIRASVPVSGFVKAELGKFDALRTVSETNMRAAAKQIEGTTPQQLRDKTFAESQAERFRRQDIQNAKFAGRQISQTPVSGTSRRNK